MSTRDTVTPIPKVTLVLAESLWHLADFYDVPELKEIFQNAIEALLCPESALLELSSPFARIYSDIASVFEDYASENWVGHCTTGIV